jgi:DNA-binding NarL/FixJ family response regulator
VLLVDDSPTFLEQARAWLSRESDIEVVGSAVSGDEAIALVKQLNPRVVLMDIAMPGMNGLEATRRLKLLAGPPLVMMVSLDGDPAHRTAAAAAGADGFLCKADFAAAVLSTLRALCRESNEPPAEPGAA